MRVTARAYELLQAPQRYPDVYGESLRAALSKRHKISSEQIVVGPGSWALLDNLASTLRYSNATAVVFRYRFSGFSYVLKRHHYEVIEIPETFGDADRRIGFDIHELREAVILIANPSNPSGKFIRREQVDKWVSQIHPSNIVLIDEAYIEYVQDYDNQSALPLVSSFDNVIVLRTFSKAYGLANLRVGWLYSSRKLISLLKSKPLPYSVSGVALEAATVALDDEDFILQCAKKNRNQLNMLRSTLTKHNIISLDSEANFVSANFGSFPEAHSIFKKNGLLYRDLSVYSLPGWIRMTVGDDTTMRLIETSLSELVLD